MASLNKGFTNVFFEERLCGRLDISRENEGIMTRSMVGLAPYGTLRVHVKNVPPANGSDEIRINYENGPFVTFGGATVNEILLNSSALANRYVKVSWVTVISGVLTSFEDSVFVPKGETANYLLEY
jgi:hypothetical protein